MDKRDAIKLVAEELSENGFKKGYYYVFETSDVVRRDKNVKCPNSICFYYNSEHNETEIRYINRY